MAEITVQLNKVQLPVKFIFLPPASCKAASCLLVLDVGRYREAMYASQSHNLEIKSQTGEEMRDILIQILDRMHPVSIELLLK